VVDPNQIISELKDHDPFRYFLLREVPFGQDGDFSHDALIGRINSELANGIGNLLSRTLTLIERNTSNLIPTPSASAETELEAELRQACLELLNKQLPETMERLEFNRALEAIWRVIQLANQYVDKTAPWNLAKNPKDTPKFHTVLYHMAETLRILALGLYPFVPDTAKGLLTQLGMLELFYTNPFSPSDLNWGRLDSGIPIRKGRHLFPRIESKPQGAKTVSEPTASPQPTSTVTATTAAATPESQITIDEFQKIQLKTALVLSAERVPKSEKLLKLQVDLGSEQRQIVAGIGKKYEPEQLIGKRIVIVANLKPAKLMGIESQGMVLAAGDKDVGGLMTVVEDVPAGTKVK